MDSGLPTQKEWLEIYVTNFILRGLSFLIGIAGIAVGLGLWIYQIVRDIPSASRATTAGAATGCLIPIILMLLGIGGISLWRRIR